MRVCDLVRVMCVVRVRSSAHANVTCGAMCVRACMHERMSGRAWMQVNETHVQYLFVQYEDGWSAVGYQLICGRYGYICVGACAWAWEHIDSFVHAPFLPPAPAASCPSP